MKLFEYNNFSKDDFEKAINNVKNTTLEELVTILQVTLKEAYGECLSYPSNCCDFASAFGVFIFHQLGYEVEYWSSNVRSKDRIEHGHSFLKIGEQVVDFTVDQFGILEPGLIDWEDFMAYYDDTWIDRARTKGNKYPKFEQFQDHKNNFVIMIIYQAIDAFIKLNLKDYESYKNKT